MARRSLSLQALVAVSGLSAAGTTQGTATSLVGGISHIATTASGTGVVLPTSSPGIDVTVINRGANALLVYPPVSSSIDALAANAGYSVAVNETVTFKCVTDTTWYSIASTSTTAVTQAAGDNSTLIATTAFVTTEKLTPRNQTLTSSATVTATSLDEIVMVTAQAAACNFANPTGTYASNQSYVIAIKDNGTARGLSWGTSFQARTGTLPSTTVVGEWSYFSVTYNATAAKHIVLTAPASGGGTTTNALTMNSGGAGDVSGSTFNGSAARTLSYNSIGAAPLAAPTFTGVPAAPTAAVGTNTTQLATTAFVMAAVKQIPFTAQNTAYTLVAGDAGRGVKKTDTTARTYTVNNSVFAADDVVTLSNYSSTANITVASGAGFTMYLAGTTTTGSRTIAPRGVATIVFESASVGYISGPGVT